MSIDWWTLGFQTVNVAVLVWLLQRFFWRPVADMIQLRRTTAQAALADAQATKATAATALAQIDLTRAGFTKEHDAIVQQARVAAEKVGATVIAQATQTVADMQNSAKAAIEKERHAAQAEWSDRSSKLAVQIAGRLAARLDGATVRNNFRDWLINAVSNLPESQRQVTNLSAVSAKTLDPAEQKNISGLIARALGGSPAITFQSDPTLIEGLELHGPHLVISNSWRADLGKILGDLTDGH